MQLTDEEITKVIDFVKSEPRTVQEVSKILKRSWLTTDKYLGYIKDKTGLINIRTFRPGTPAALKIVYYINREIAVDDEIRKNLSARIMNSNFESDFDFMECFQFIDDKKKKAYFDQYKKRMLLFDKKVISLLGKTKSSVYIFSGNLSFIGVHDDKITLIDLIEKLLKKGVYVKILTRIDMVSLSNIQKIAHLIGKYPEYLELRHRYQPLRGFIVDDEIARLKNEEHVADYRSGELHKNTRIFYEVYDKGWVKWLSKIFWTMFNSSMNYAARKKEINRILTS